ncbi:LAMI_0D00672g1_1 [Lachancea mirantina]|uniref:LAMI_0D00672g1_1 n=1 Tax=Lachancea mirantina TaxID=1230905 RepID=A0A1G4J874_9SACH|nr:LAMI_0D00672g1_1 [Lachancea mirantina]
MSFDANHTAKDVFGSDDRRADAADAAHGTGLHNADFSDATPNILLEQLAYVDNFMPELDNSLHAFGPMLDGDDGQGTALGLDDRLAAELSAFADETFIFPDEEKPHDAGPNDAGGSSGDPSGVPATGPDRPAAESWPELHNGQADATTERGSSGRNSHYLSRHRSNFLASQYDNARQRFSSKDRQTHTSHSPEDDHGGFTNVDMAERESQPFSRQGQNGNVPYSASPLSNLIADFSRPEGVSRPYSLSNTPESSQNTAPDRAFAVSSLSQPPQHAQNDWSRIQMPEYSSIPTSTILALLPRVRVPPGAYRSLQSAGFEHDQIEAIAALIAYHQTQKARLNASAGNSTISAAASASPNAQGPDLASFLFQFINQEHDSPGSQQSEPGRASNAHEPRQNHATPSSDFLNSLVDFKGPKPPVNAASKKPVDPDSSRAPTVPTASVNEEKLNNVETAPVVKRSESQTEIRTTSEGPVPKANNKRKLKERELESSIQEVSELAVNLQKRIHTLEMENRLLKNLIMEKGELTGIEQVEGVRREVVKSLNTPQSSKSAVV